MTLSDDMYCADTSSATTPSGKHFDVEGVDHDGLVGLACTTGEFKDKLGCAAFAANKETFVYNRDADGNGQVCFSTSASDECDPVRRYSASRVALDTSTPVPVADGMILDTGTSGTSELPLKMQKPFGASCLVGFPDIQYLELNYGNGYIDYVIDRDAVKDKCPHLPLWDEEEGSQVTHLMGGRGMY